MFTRVIRRPLALCALVAWLVGLSAPVIGQHELELGEGGSGWGEHTWAVDSGTARFTLPASLQDDGHCGLCHLQRAAHSAFSVVASTSAIPDASPTVHVPVQVRSLSGLTSGRAPRAPPAL